jgi:transcriptional regulator with PAS, ATPase and Fis domain
MNIQQVKQRFGIIGNSDGLLRAINVAMQVAPTDISVLISGESGTGKEIMPQIIHHYSSRKHAEYIAVNCGAIPEGTIDSELFGHEKGSFTGATDSRKGYFEVANGGTIFLDEVVELPLETQVRLLRVLETGEFIRVGSSKVIKTDVRIIAATNENMMDAIRKGKFREDLYYRLSTVPINLPPLRERKEDIHLLFRKFASDFAEKYRMPSIRLDDEAAKILGNYRWPGNIRQLKNIAEQISVIEEDREISAQKLLNYLPQQTTSNLPMVINEGRAGNDFSERDILYKILFDMRNDITEVKKVILSLLQDDAAAGIEHNKRAALIRKLNTEIIEEAQPVTASIPLHRPAIITPVSADIPMAQISHIDDSYQDHEEVEETFSLSDQEKELILKALDKHNFKKKYAAQELGISERTLYRKLIRYGIEGKKKKKSY